MKKIQQNSIGIIVVVIIGTAIFFIFRDKTETSNIVTPSNTVAENRPIKTSVLTNEEINNQVDETLSVLLGIHYVSLDDIELKNQDTVILDMLQESMNDLNKLKGLSYKVETLSASKNEIISTTGLVLKVTILGLTQANDAWVKYLRGIDVNTIQLSEFQYQLSLYNTATHDAYLKLVEGASLLPAVAIEFPKEKGGQSITKRVVAEHFLSQIESLFGDVLKANQLFYAETKNRYAVAVLIEGYRKFLVEAVQTK